MELFSWLQEISIEVLETKSQIPFGSREQEEFSVIKQFVQLLPKSSVHTALNAMGYSKLPNHSQIIPDPGKDNALDT